MEILRERGGEPDIYTVTGAVSQDGVAWTTIGNPVSITISCCGTLQAGAIVNSHDVSSTTHAGDFLSTTNLLSLTDTDRFAKAGLMARDGIAADAMFVVLDVKPNGEVEFMARLCTGCEVQYLAGTTVTLPAELIQVRQYRAMSGREVADFG